MPQTRRVEAKKLPIDVYNSMKMIIKYTGESQSAFINRAIRAEVERRGREVRTQMASRATKEIRDKRIAEHSKRWGSRKALAREAARIQGEETSMINMAVEQVESANDE